MRIPPTPANMLYCTKWVVDNMILLAVNSKRYPSLHPSPNKTPFTYLLLISCFLRSEKGFASYKNWVVMEILFGVGVNATSEFGDVFTFPYLFSINFVSISNIFVATLCMSFHVSGTGPYGVVIVHWPILVFREGRRVP